MHFHSSLSSPLLSSSYSSLSQTPHSRERTFSSLSLWGTRRQRPVGAWQRAPHASKATRATPALPYLDPCESNSGGGGSTGAAAGVWRADNPRPDPAVAAAAAVPHPNLMVVAVPRPDPAVAGQQAFCYFYFCVWTT
jgi:hypothetical protein